ATEAASAELASAELAQAASQPMVLARPVGGPCSRSRLCLSARLCVPVLDDRRSSAVASPVLDLLLRQCGSAGLGDTAAGLSLGALWAGSVAREPAYGFRGAGRLRRVLLITLQLLDSIEGPARKAGPFF